MQYTTKDLTEKLKKMPFHMALTNSKNVYPELSSYTGHFLQLCLPNYLTQEDGQPFLSLSYPDQNLHTFYGFEKSNQRHVSIAKDDLSYESLKYKRPGKLSTFVRGGELKNYLHYFSSENSYALPLLLYFSLFEEEYLNEASSLVKDLLHQRRVSFIITNKFYANKLLSKDSSSFRSVIEIKNAYLKVTNKSVFDSLDALPFKQLVSSEISKISSSGYSQESLYILVSGIGYGRNTFSIDPLTLSSYPEWNRTAEKIRHSVSGTLSTHLFNAHHAFIKSVLEAKQVLVPHLNLYPTPPEFVIDNKLELNRKLKVKKTNGLTSLFLDLDNKLLTQFNATQGRNTGIIDALLSKPNLLSQGLSNTKPLLKDLGYELIVDKQLENFIERKTLFYKKEAQPLNPVTNTELLAYYSPGKYLCKKTLMHPITLSKIWTKGMYYNITPSWTREEFDAGNEPVVNEMGSIIGSDTYKIRLSVLELLVDSNQNIISIKENKTRSLEEDSTSTTTKKSESSETLKKAKWEPLLDEFLESFDLPVVEDVSVTRAQEISQLKERLLKRLPHLKPYQVDETVKNSLKKGGILASVMGSGKTHMGMGVLYLRNKAFNLIIVPPSLVSNWSKTLREHKFFVRKLLSHSSVDRLIEHYSKLKNLPPLEKRKKMYADQEFYITTPEFLALGDTGNMVYDEWTATYNKRGKRIDDDKYGKLMIYETCEVKSTRFTSMGEAKELAISLNQSHEYGHHIQECPKCKAKKNNGFTHKGYCNNCGYSAFSYIGNRVNKYVISSKETVNGKDFIFGPHTTFKKIIEDKQSFTTQTPKAKITQTIRLTGKDGAPVRSNVIEKELITQPKTHSNYSVPAYKRLGKIFGSKLIDEVHEVANFDSLRGAAVKSVKCDETWACSGTLSRGHVKDIESALLHSYESNSPICPYSEWNRQAFREQFITQKVKKTTLHDDKKVLYKKGTKTSVSIVPEASNVTLLRKVLSSKMTMVSPDIVEAEWNLPSMSRTYVPVKLSKDNLKYYYEVLNNIATWYKHATSKDLRRNMMSKLWELRHICEGEDKLKVIESYIQQWGASKHKFVLVSPTKPMYIKMIELLKKYSIKHICVDEKTPASKREEITTRFEDPNIQAVVSRTKLINTGLNTLVHADKLLISGLEYFPSVLRQMERRLVRPGQKSSHVEIVYPIVRITPRESIEEQMLRLIFRKETAVNEILEGKVRWIKSAQLIESIMEKQGASKVLQAIVSDDDNPISDIDLETLFNSPISLDDVTAKAIDNLKDDKQPFDDLDLAFEENKILEEKCKDVITKDSELLPIVDFELPKS